MSAHAHDKDAAFAVMDELTERRRRDRSRAATRARSSRTRTRTTTRRSRGDPVLARVPRAARAHRADAEGAGDAHGVDAVSRRRSARCSPAARDPGAQLLASSTRSGLREATIGEPRTRAPVLQRQLRDFAVVRRCSRSLVATCGVRRRAQHRARRAPDRPRQRAAAALADGRAPLPTVHGRARRRRRRRRRSIRISATVRSTRPMARGAARRTERRRRDDKLFYDAANALRPRRRVRRAAARCERPRDAARDRPRESRARAAVAGQSRSRSPRPPRRRRYPCLVLIGVLGLGAALAAAGALVGRRAARVGMFAGVAALAVPTMLWHAWIATAAIVLLGGARRARAARAAAPIASRGPRAAIASRSASSRRPRSRCSCSSPRRS